MAYFFSYWQRAIGSKWGPLEVLAQSKFIRVCQIRSTLACFDHISFVKTQNCSLFVLLDSLFAKVVSVKIHNFCQPFD